VEQLKSVWNGLSPMRRALAGLAAVAVFAAVLGIARLATTPGMALLYAGLETQAAGEVMERLSQRGVLHEIRGDAIFVPMRDRDALRLSLAADGLPANGARGYELLDGLSGFGTTSQMFDAAYWRAKEGELARTIVASPHIRAARVHIAHSGSRPFRRDVAPTASVSVTPVQGTLAPAQARALRYLVAAAVAGLDADSVAVVDAAGNLLTSGDDPSAQATTGADRAEDLRRNVLRLLEAHVGPGRAVVEVVLDTVTDRESVIERRVDPASRVAISSDSEERQSEAEGSGSPSVGVASNLPDGEAAGAGNSRSRQSESRERVNWEVSETRRELHRGPGAVRRLTVAVLIDSGAGTMPDGTPLPGARSATDLEALRELVASAVGYDAERGDVITLRALPFEARLEAGSGPQGPGFTWPALDPMRLVQLLVLAGVALVLGLFVVRPILAGSRRATDTGASLPARLAAGTAPAALAAPIRDPAEGGAGLPALAGGADRGMAELLDNGEPGAVEAEPVARLRRLIEQRQTETVEILRGWMEEHEENA